MQHKDVNMTMYDPKSVPSKYIFCPSLLAVCHCSKIDSSHGPEQVQGKTPHA
jgi:hypothetical protein